jgi:hypothetical protein
MRTWGGATESHPASRWPGLDGMAFFDFPGDVELGMVPQVSPDAGEVVQYWNSEPLQIRRRTYPGEHQYLG